MSLSAGGGEVVLPITFTKLFDYKFYTVTSHEVEILHTVVSGISDNSAYPTKCYRYLWKNLVSPPFIKA